MTFTLEGIAALTAESIAASENVTIDETIDALAAQFHTEQDAPLKKEIGKKYVELAKARNTELGRKYFYESIQAAEKQGTTKAPVKPEKTTASKSTEETLTNQAGATVDGQAEVPGTSESTEAGAKEGEAATESKPAATTGNRIKITDEIVQRVIGGIAQGLKPKEIAALKLDPLPTENGGEGEPRSMGITADNVYDILHLRGRFGQNEAWVKGVTDAKIAAAAITPAPKPAAPKKAGKKADETPTDATAAAEPGGAEITIEQSNVIEGDSIPEPTGF